MHEVFCGLSVAGTLVFGIIYVVANVKEFVAICRVLRVIIMGTSTLFEEGTCLHRCYRLTK